VAKCDLVLLHAPHVYDFRQKTILHGPVSDLVPPSPVFEMYPLGMASIAEYLERGGYRVRIVNLAVRMLKSKNFDAEAFIKKLKAPVFGIDLHWLVHAHGAVEVARLVKKHHPQAKVVMGGIASSYFHRELLEYPEVDFVIRGDSTEEPFRQLMDALKSKQSPETVPNLTWRDDNGNIRGNPFSHVPDDLSPVMVNHYTGIIRSVIRHLDFASITPTSDWMRYPITATLTCRGCTQNCVICGGSRASYKDYMNRRETVYRSPQQVVQDIKNIAHFSNGPVFVLGDIRQQGQKYADELLSLLGKGRVKNRLIFELFRPASAELLLRMGRASPGFCLEISPETHDPEVRRAAGKHYSNEELEQTINDALGVGCGRLQVFFMIGLPKQTPASVMETIDYCGHLMDRFRDDNRLSLFIGPLAPFLDPGSLAFEQPERYGYHILFRTLEEHRQALLAPSWRYTLNYETEWMTRQQIMGTTYEAVLRLNRLKAEYGFVSPETAARQEWRIKAALELEHRISELWEGNNSCGEIDGLKAEVDRINAFRASEREELELPIGLMKLKFLRPLWSLLTTRR
jgi:B12-binding domain/radical SAM domain protein